ncbi:WXG100 family type VII secretion target [Nocardioides sp. SR21]|uniref:WXG100 family type VII secretion target n=1 Tax=Nocardioides sp. SR21 TaxID=2919501 RepID=UPI001FA95EE7|nr:WXG100 family type VII secretion target [Nocardioides sp. SR21]
MYAVDLDELLGTIDEMARCGAELEALLDHVAAIHLPWSGRAAVAQAAAQAEWEAGFGSMREALGVMRAAAGVAHGSYADAAATNLRMWEQVR